MNRLDALLATFGIQPSEIAGTTLSGEVPLTNGVVNRFIAAQLAQRNTPVATVQIEAHDGDTFTALLVAKTRLVPPIRIAVVIERQPDLPRDAVLGLRWSLPRLGPLARLAAPALSFLNALPAGIRADDDRIVVDIRQLAVDRGVVDLLQYLTRLQVGTRAGAFIVRFEAGVSSR